MAKQIKKMSGAGSLERNSNDGDFVNILNAMHYVDYNDGELNQILFDRLKKVTDFNL